MGAFWARGQGDLSACEKLGYGPVVNPTLYLRHPLEEVVVAIDQLVHSVEPVQKGRNFSKLSGHWVYEDKHASIFCYRVYANSEQHTDLQPIHVPEVPWHRAMLMGQLINGPAL